MHGANMTIIKMNIYEISNLNLDVIHRLFHVTIVDVKTISVTYSGLG
jgi:hypothetical protein